MKLGQKDKEKIIEIRKELLNFYSSTRKKFDFEVKCDLEVRIKFIYSIIFPGFDKFKFYFRFLIARIAQISDLPFMKIFLYRLIGVKIGKGVFISPSVIIDPHYPSLIEIEDYAILGWGAQLFPHEFSGQKYRIGRIIIKRGAVIGGFATIRGGVTIGENASVASLSIVVKDVPKNYLLDSVIVLNKALIETYKKQRDLL